MKKGKPAVKIVCAQYCPYHKEGKNEEFECRAYAVAELLLEEGLHIPPINPGKDNTPSGSGVVEIIRQQICTGCLFCAADCEFITSGGKAKPCGGFVVISHLLRSGLITREDLTDIICLA